MLRSGIGVGRAPRRSAALRWAPMRRGRGLRRLDAAAVAVRRTAAAAAGVAAGVLIWWHGEALAGSGGAAVLAGGGRTLAQWALLVVMPPPPFQALPPAPAPRRATTIGASETHPAPAGGAPVDLLETEAVWSRLLAPPADAAQQASEQTEPPAPGPAPALEEQPPAVAPAAAAPSAGVAEPASVPPASVPPARQVVAAAATATAVPARPTAVPARRTPTPAARSGDVLHTVGDGDTLWTLASRYNTTVEAIVKANTLANPDQLALGARLRIPR